MKLTFLNDKMEKMRSKKIRKYLSMEFKRRVGISGEEELDLFS